MVDRKKIPLTQGKYAIVDIMDYDWLMQWNWHYHNGYARTYIGRNNGVDHYDRMHRFIMGIYDGMEIDHINGNGIDNRRLNLRICTHSQNCVNRHKKGGSSKYKGVFWRKRQRCWMAQIAINKKTFYLGYFDNEKLAAHTYNNAALKYHGEFASLNII